MSKMAQGSNSNQVEESSVIEDQGVIPQQSRPSYARVAEKSPPTYGAGRGKYLRELEEKFSRQRLDEIIQTDLREVIGPGYSNELIEQRFGSSSYSDEGESTEKTGVFSDSEREKGEEIEATIGESMIMKRVLDMERGYTSSSSSSSSSFKKSKSPRCRNTVLLSLAQNKDPEKNVENEPVLKNPNLLLKPKSFRSAVAENKADSGSEQGVPPLSSDESYPPLG